MYGQWFRKNVEINDAIPCVSDRTEARARAKEFLARQGFRDLVETDNRISASRGSRFHSLFNVGGDPRRNAHTIELVEDPPVLRVRMVIASWFSLGTKYDTAVFTAELGMLKRFVESGQLDDTPLREAQREQMRSDLRTVALGLIVGIAIGAIVFGVIHSMML